MAAHTPTFDLARRAVNQYMRKQKHTEVTDIDAEFILADTAGAGDMDTLNELYIYLGKPPLGTSFTRAAHNGQWDVILQLLDFKPVHARHHLEAVFDGAITGGKLDLLKKCMHHPQLGHHLRNVLTYGPRFAIMYYRNEVYKFLLSILSKDEIMDYITIMVEHIFTWLNMDALYILWEYEYARPAVLTALRERFDRGYRRRTDDNWPMTSPSLYPDLELRRRLTAFRDFLEEHQS
jgi:hypothetical protein